MFGKPEWFKEKTFGWGLTPITWQGWVYTLVWLGVLVLPFLAFLFIVGKAPEACLWLGFGIMVLFWDVKSIIREMRYLAAGDVFVIDEETDSSHLDTRNYDMHIRD